MKIKNAEVNVLAQCLANLKNKGLSGATGYKIVKLQSKLDAQAEIIEKARQEIVKGLLNEGEESFESTDPRMEEFNTKYSEMMMESVELDGLNFLTEDELMYCTEGVSFDIIRMANKFLVITESEMEEIEK